MSLLHTNPLADAARLSGTVSAMAAAGAEGTEATAAAAAAVESRTRVGASTSATSHYGNPAVGCESDEEAYTVTGLAGSFCSPQCSSDAACPHDYPAGTDGPEGLCVLESPGATKPDHCALVCSPSGDSCPTGATCKIISDGQGVCTYNN